MSEQQKIFGRWSDYNSMIGDWCEWDNQREQARQRILARLQAALAELRRGMKEVSDGRR